MGRELKKKDAPKPESVTADGTPSGAQPCEEKPAKRGWSDVFDNLTYSDGPGDNIYVFG